MLNTPVPYEVNTVHSGRYNYPPSTSASPAPSYTPRLSVDEPSQSRSRRSSAAIASEDEHCVTLANPITDAPPVIIFFSFLDPQSKKWTFEHQVAQTLRKSLPQGYTVSRYHAPMRFAWDFGETLTHAWATAESLHVDDKVIGPMFEAVHSKQVHDLEGIRAVFDHIGIDPTTLMKEWGTPQVKRIKADMDNAVAHLDLQENHVPGILVKGKYAVKLDSYKDDFSADTAVDLVRRLLVRE